MSCVLRATRDAWNDASVATADAGDMTATEAVARRISRADSRTTTQAPICKEVQR